MCTLHADGPKVWQRAVAQVAAFPSRPLDPEGSGKALVLDGAYHLSSTQTTTPACHGAEPLEAAAVALPGDDHKLVPLLPLLGWPYSVLFGAPEGSSEEGSAETAAQGCLPPAPKEVAECWAIRDTLDPRDHTRLRRFENFASADDRVDFFVRLLAATMLELWGEVPEETNGVFGLPKGDKQRFIVDMRPGNGWWMTVADLQREYARLIESDPERARREGATASALDLLRSETFARLPPGCRSFAAVDYSNFFHSFLVPVAWRRLQGLGRVDPADFGLKPEDYPDGCWAVLRTLPMGARFAPLLAQAAHRRVIRPAMHAMRFRRPAHTSAAWQAALTRTLGFVGDDGCVAAKDIDPALLRGVWSSLDGDDLAASPRMGDDLRVPLSALSLEPASPDDAAAAVITLVPVEMTHSAFEANVHRVRAMPGHYATPAFVFIDDSGAWVAPPYEDEPNVDKISDALADRRLLLQIGCMVGANFTVQNRKLQWSGTGLDKALGYYCLQTGDGTMTIGVHKEKLAQHAQLARRLAYQAQTSPVRVREVLHVLGGFTWACLVRRSLLSIFGAIYNDVSTRHTTPDDLVWLSAASRQELNMAADLAPFMQVTTRPFANTVLAWDASSTGYGACYLDGVSTDVLLALCCAFPKMGAAGTFPPPQVGPHMRTRNGVDPTAFAEAVALLRDHDPWKVCRYGRYPKRAPFILLGEAGACLRSLRWACNRPNQVAGRTVVGLGDNTAQVCAFAKGRSSTPSLNRYCRMAAALSITFDVVFRYVWVPTYLQPADEPSRRYE